MDKIFYMFSYVPTKADISVLDSQNHAVQNKNSLRYFLLFLAHLLNHLSFPPCYSSSSAHTSGISRQSSDAAFHYRAKIVLLKMVRV